MSTKPVTEFILCDGDKLINTNHIRFFLSYTIFLNHLVLLITLSLNINNIVILCTLHINFFLIIINKVFKFFEIITYYNLILFS